MVSACKKDQKGCSVVSNDLLVESHKMFRMGKETPGIDGIVWNDKTAV